MKSRDSQVRLKLFQVNEKRRQVLQLDMMLADFERMAGELDNQIGSEERKSGITDTNHFAYPTFAKAARQRRDNLMTSVEDLLGKLAVTKRDLEGVEEELRRSEQAGDRVEERTRFSRRPSARTRRPLQGPNP